MLATELNLEQFEADGCAVVERVCGPETLARLCEEITRLRGNSAEGSEGSGTYAGVRHLLERSAAVRELVVSPELRSVVEPILGRAAFCVRGLLFDKSAATNWWVGWHQDLFITVREKMEVAGYRGFWRKEGVLHVIPPLEILANMLTVRLHLDDCPADHGPLEVWPRSHAWGLVAPEALSAETSPAAVRVLTVNAGGVVLMRPLTVHASRKMTGSGSRRVLHLEFANRELAGGLNWRWRV